MGLAWRTAVNWSAQCDQYVWPERGKERVYEYRNVAHGEGRLRDDVVFTCHMHVFYVASVWHAHRRMAPVTSLLVGDSAQRRARPRSNEGAPASLSLRQTARFSTDAGWTESDGVPTFGQMSPALGIARL